MSRAAKKNCCILSVVQDFSLWSHPILKVQAPSAVLTGCRAQLPVMQLGAQGAPHCPQKRGISFVQGTVSQFYSNTPCNLWYSSQLNTPKTNKSLPLFQSKEQSLILEPMWSLQGSEPDYSRKHVGPAIPWLFDFTSGPSVVPRTEQQVVWKKGKR